MSRLQRDVLRLCAIPRSTGDIAFLYGEAGGDPAEVGACLAEFERLGWVSRSTAGLWSQTAAGSQSLRRADEWEVLVDDVRHMPGCPRPVIAGTLSERLGALSLRSR